MSATLLDPPTTEAQLRARAEELAGEVAEQLAPREQEPARPAFFEEIRGAALSLAASPAWRWHDLTTELLLLVERLRDELAAGGDDPAWRVREVLQRMLVVLRAMVRRLMHDAIDRPEQAARFVAEALGDLGKADVAELLGTTPRMVANYRRGEVGQIRKNPARVTLVGQLVYELIGSMTARGVLLWFDARSPQLGGRTPRELLDEDPATHRPALMALARGGRAQTDRGGASYGALDDGA